jgi:hypothetical protein
MEEMRNVYTFVDGKPEGKRPLERPTLKCAYNIKMDLKETVGLCGLDSSGSGWSVAGSCEDGNKTYDSIKGGKFLDLLNC